MANTRMIKEVEREVQSWLSEKYPGHSFQEKKVTLTTGYEHEFDAVSENRSIVGAILSSRARTRTGNENTGAVRKAQVDVCLLNLLPAHITKLMVFTHKDFSRLVQERAAKLGTKSIEMLYYELSGGLQERLDKTLDDASHEQRAAE